ncbi:MAG: 16S rRNA (uracil(1498)-N(3))-methyltransferase [Bacteroidales bacterium]|nr:16S rRNA (uracil(1498)-N(3))-methyltransferase [Bacteroidales bacterium]
MDFFFNANLLEGVSSINIEQSKHLRVLRKKVGDIIVLTNGKGLYSECEIEKIDNNGCVVNVLDIKQAECPKQRLTLGISPLKNPDRFEWLVEKCTEFGVGKIVPIVCERTESTIKKPERLQRIVEAAFIQSQQFYMPEITAPISFLNFLKEHDNTQKIIAWCGDYEKTPLISAMEKNKNTVCLIGPEGDFTKNEFEIALNNGYKPVTLGENRLRSETAAVCVSNAFYLINNEL